MNQYFFDSSALVKRYVAEPGTLWLLDKLTARSRYAPLVAQIAQVEICSSVMRRAREGTLSQQEARLTRLLIDFDMAREYRVIALTGDVVALAEDLLERHALRASDAIQLASALQSSLRLGTAAPGMLEFVSSDARLLAAAEREGLTTVDPSTRK